MRLPAVADGGRGSCLHKDARQRLQLLKLTVEEQLCCDTFESCRVPSGRLVARLHAAAIGWGVLPVPVA